MQKHIAAGAKRVILTQPSSANKEKGTKKAEFSLLIGVNDQQLPDVETNDCASCTTNNFVPAIWSVAQFGEVLAGYMQTVHSYTGSQSLTDSRPTGKDGAGLWRAWVWIW